MQEQNHANQLAMTQTDLPCLEVVKREPEKWEPEKWELVEQGQNRVNHLALSWICLVLVRSGSVRSGWRVHE